MTALSVYVAIAVGLYTLVLANAAVTLMAKRKAIRSAMGCALPIYVVAAAVASALWLPMLLAAVVLGVSKKERAK